MRLLFQWMLLLGAVLGAVTAEAKPRPARCPGTYVLLGDAAPLFASGPAPSIDAIVVDGEGVRVRSGCPATRPRFTARGDGWRLRARWKRCGAATRVRLRAVISSDCRGLTGTVSARRPAMGRVVAAAVTACGDGLVDRESGEACEPPGLGVCGASCTIGALSRCGDAVIDPGEECDDGDSDDRDGCTTGCQRPCREQDFASTFEAIQAVILERRGCAAAQCHDVENAQGGLDLSPEAAYANLVNVPSAIDPQTLRVTPGEHEASLLYQKLRAGVSGVDDVPGAPMPFTGPALSADELDAVRLWIRAGASSTAVVEGTAALLDACLGPPIPTKSEPPPPPADGEGVQLYAPPWDIPPRGEREVCFATYYDVEAHLRTHRPDALVPCPAEWRGAGRTCFSYHTTELTQDPNSHHSIIRAYRGSAAPTDASFGPYTCHGGVLNGRSCNPLAVGPPPGGRDCGARSACAGRVVPSLACIGYGPSDFGFTVSVLGTQAAPMIAGAQAPHTRQPLPAGVYRVLPVRGALVWNSHAFNLTNVSTTNEQWLTLSFAGRSERTYPAIDLANDSRIFLPEVPPFAQREFCGEHVFLPGTRLFELSSHTHKRGVLFRIWDPSGALLYTSTDYSDPAVLRFNPPLALDQADWRRRTFRYCALYDNGATDPATVKRRSTSPPAFIGGPCGDDSVVCVAGPHKGMHCGGDERRCDGAPGAGDGECDACPLRGGVTTEDEMFILLGAYYAAP